MILEITEQAVKRLSPNSSLIKDLGKLIVGIVILFSMIVVSCWGLLMLGSNGQKWYALLYPIVAVVYSSTCVVFLMWLDPRFAE